MKKTPTYIKPPKRSSSLVSRITRPIIEQQVQKAISPSSSFSSSILTKGMSDRITPPPTPQKSNDHASKSSRRRTIDYTRRRTITGLHEQISNKENIAIKNQDKSPGDIYQFTPSSSNAKVELQIPSSKSPATKKYYFQCD